jgi:hypothetical protein
VNWYILDEGGCALFPDICLDRLRKTIRNLTRHTRFEVFIAVKIGFIIFWVVAPRVVVGYQHFGG